MLSFTESVVALLKTHSHSGMPPSAAICVSTNQQTDTGVLSLPESTPIFNPDAPFIIYSITKSFLATTALKLVAQHVLEIDIPIIRWLPDIPHANIITLRHLLHHASGLPDYGGLTLYHEAVRRGDQPWSDEEFLMQTQSDHLLYPPGQGWSYSNIGYMIVRQLLETVQTANLPDILNAEIFAPLGLATSYVVTSDEQLKQLTFGPSTYLGSPEHPVTVAERYHVDWVAHRAIASTVTDIAHFFDALFDGELLPPALLREMCTYMPLPKMSDRPVLRPGYGLGLQIDHGWASGPMYGHSGGGPGAHFNVYSLRNDSAPITVAVAVTGENIAQAEEIAVEIFRQHNM